MFNELKDLSESVIANVKKSKLTVRVQGVLPEQI